MKISYYTHQHGLNTSTGFGYAGLNIVQSLQALGHKVPFDDPSADVQICFTQPQDYKFGGDGLRVGYTPWESTELKPGWKQQMNACDEVWTPSDLIAQWFSDAGVTKPIYVYEHGVSEDWYATHRTRSKTLKFLHHGAEANRKHGQLAYDAFIATFGKNNPNVSLTFKSNGPAGVRDTVNGAVYRVDRFNNNVKFITNELSQQGIVSLYLMHDVLVYPSAGEGFGFSPLQAMATGMPVILNPEWAPYRDLTIPELNISSKMVDSNWFEHPGKVFEPSFVDLCRAYREAYDNYDEFAIDAFTISDHVKQRFGWLNVTKDILKHIK